MLLHETPSLLVHWVFFARQNQLVKVWGGGAQQDGALSAYWSAEKGCWFSGSSVGTNELEARSVS